MRTSDIPPMHKVLPPAAVGVAAVEHFTVSEHESRMTMLSSRPAIRSVPAGRYARLTVRNQVVMSDTRMERQSNYAVIRESHGDVLIAGLGLGMILTAILPKPDVRTVTVVEKEPDVIALVEPPLRAKLKDANKLTVLAADIHDYRTVSKFDTIYFDIWPEINGDNLPEMARLHQKFKYRLRRGDGLTPWMGSWMQDYLRSERNADRTRYIW